MTPARFTAFRSHFPGVNDGVFMSVAQRGLIPIQVRDAIAQHVEKRTGVGWSKEESFKLVEQTRIAFAELVNAHPDEIAFTKNVSDKLLPESLLQLEVASRIEEKEAKKNNNTFAPETSKADN